MMNLIMTKKILFTCFVLLVGSLSFGQAVPKAIVEGGIDNNAEAFIQELGNDVISILFNRKETMNIRKEQFRKEIREHFDLPTIGRFIMSRYWRSMSDAQKDQYLRLFEDAVIENYASQFDNYANQQLVITGSRPTKDKGMVVHTEIPRDGNTDSLDIKWKVFDTSRGLKVLDVIVNNVSMSITLRNEYVSAMNARGGIDGLLSYLREKISEDRRKQRS